MIPDDGHWREQINKVMPDLEIESYELLQEGLVNDVLVVNGHWIIRFTHTEWGENLMAVEDQLMRFIAPKVTLSVPSPEICADGVMVYHLLEGGAFLRGTWADADHKAQQSLAEQLGRFLYELHHLPTGNLDWEIPLTLAPVTLDTWLDIHDRFVEKVQPLLLPHQVEWAEHLFNSALNRPDFFDFNPVLIHGDLTPYHILYSEDQGCLNAVIDFGLAGLGDPATDLGSLINSYGETLVSKIVGTYPDLEKLLPRARFYAQAMELNWALLGVESGENYWFMAHLGGARDIRTA